MKFRTAGEKRKFFRNMQFNQTARAIGVATYKLLAMVLPAFMLVGLTATVTALAAHSGGHHGHNVLLAGAAPAPAINAQALLSRITRDQGPEYEQTLTFTTLAQVSTPTSIRTDRKIKFILLHFRGRITNPATGPTLRTAPTLLGTQLYALIQQVTIRGQHLRYGAQVPIQMRGETCAEWMALVYPNWVPQFTVSQNGAAPVRSGALTATANQTNDIDFVLPIPMFPIDVSAADSVFYSLHGPDWPGNLYIDVACGDGTSIATANVPTTFSAYGGSTGSPSIDILTERPLLGKDLMGQIKPALTFRIQSTSQPTTAVSGASGTGVKITDLTVGKDTTRVFLKTGTNTSNASAGVVVYGSLLDSIVTRTFFSLDVRNLRFQNANADSALQDYMGRLYGRTVPIGYKMIDFISVVGGVANPKAAFPSSQLTAARKFELDGDVTGAANQIAEVIQEMYLGRPAMVSTQ